METNDFEAFVQQIKFQHKWRWRRLSQKESGCRCNNFLTYSTWHMQNNPASQISSKWMCLYCAHSEFYQCLVFQSNIIAWGRYAFSKLQARLVILEDMRDICMIPTETSATIQIFLVSFWRRRYTGTDQESQTRRERSKWEAEAVWEETEEDRQVVDNAHWSKTLFGQYAIYSPAHTAKKTNILSLIPSLWVV